MWARRGVALTKRTTAQGPDKIETDPKGATGGYVGPCDEPTGRCVVQGEGVVAVWGACECTPSACGGQDTGRWIQPPPSRLVGSTKQKFETGMTSETLGRIKRVTACGPVILRGDVMSRRGARVIEPLCQPRRVQLRMQGWPGGGSLALE